MMTQQERVARLQEVHHVLADLARRVEILNDGIYPDHALWEMGTCLETVGRDLQQSGFAIRCAATRKGGE